VDRRDISVTLPWMREGTQLFERLVDALSDDALRQPSGLPEWTRAHVVAHVARNAEALTRLATWARTGVETPMYPSREHRAVEIESSAKAPAATLRSELVSTAVELEAALAKLDADTLQAQVRSALGRPIPAAEVPWMRVREVWMHAVDLDAGAAVADIRPDVVDALLDDAAAMLSTKPDCPQARLAPTDRDRTWALGGQESAVELRGTAADVLGWLVGRSGADRLSTSDGSPVPVPPRWL
jgi:maleylpyruvate isomerase